MHTLGAQALMHRLHTLRASGLIHEQLKSSYISSRGPLHTAKYPPFQVYCFSSEIVFRVWQKRSQKKKWLALGCVSLRHACDKKEKDGIFQHHFGQLQEEKR